MLRRWVNTVFALIGFIAIAPVADCWQAAASPAPANAAAAAPQALKAVSYTHLTLPTILRV